MPGKYPDKIRSLPLFNGQFDAHQLSADGATVLFASYPAGTEIPPHSHSTDNYGVITRGALQLCIDGQSVRYGVGDWYHVAAGVEHSAKFASETDEIEIWFEPDA